MDRFWAVGRRIAGCLIVACLGYALPLHAQYFGRNKVQYHSFNFDVLKTEHFDVYFYPAERDAAGIAGQMAERWYTRLSTLFDHQLKGRQPLILYASPEEFRETNAVGGDLGEGTGGVTEALRRRIVLPIGGTLGDLDHVIGHELTHAFQYDVTGYGQAGVSAAAQLPLWFIEGMAEYASLGPVNALTAMWMRGALADTAKDSLPSFRQLDDPRFFPYRYGEALLTYVGGRWGDKAVPQLLRAAGPRRGLDAAIRQVLGVTPDTLVAMWHRDTHARFDSLRSTTEVHEALGQRLVAAKDAEGSYNVSPVVSPDGSRMMYFSDRGLFSIDLFLADARTGKIERQLTKTALDQHLQSIQFIQSAGSWSPDGRRLVFAGLSGGVPVLELYDTAGARGKNELKFPKLREILNPAWSPDGGRIAFSGNSGGLTDLYVYDLEKKSLERLTNDEFADLQPAWSPDGRSLAFVTDRFTSNLQTLSIGPYRIGVLDLASGAIRQLYQTNAGRQLDPQWSADGASVYYLWDPDGISNIYRLDLASGTVSRLTNLFTGVSGITETSPALSVAQRTGRLVYSVFRSNGYDIYSVDSPASEGQHVDVASQPDSGKQITDAALPPVQKKTRFSWVPHRIRKRDFPATPAFTITPYRSSLGLTYVSRPSLAVGSPSFGTYVGGGASLYFSDILGNHNLVTGLQVQGTLKDVYALLGYQNLTHRLNWAVIAEQTPYLTGGIQRGLRRPEWAGCVCSAATPRAADQPRSHPRCPIRSARPSGSTSPPAIRTSRSTGAQDRGVRCRDRGAGALQHAGSAEPTRRSISELTSLALVYDNSFFGATAPILGQRYRLEVTPTSAR